jgi:hypothetical protein
MGHSSATGDDFYIDIDRVESLARLKRLDTIFGSEQAAGCEQDVTTALDGCRGRRTEYPGQSFTVPSSRGLGHHPLKVETRVQIPLGLLRSGSLAGNGPRMGQA